MHEEDYLDDPENTYHDMAEVSNKTIEYVKLAAIIGIIAGAAFFLNSWFGSEASDEIMRWFMGIFFVTFGTFKFIGYEMFTEMFPSYDIIAAKSKVYTYAYPFIELLLGSLYLVNAIPTIRDLATLVLMSVSAYGVYKSIKSHGNVECACLGNIVKLPLSKVSFIENSSMAVMAAVMLIR